MHDGDFCQIAQPIYWADMDQLTATPAPIIRKILRHNQNWEAFCKE